jgi:hypothetical protein
MESTTKRRTARANSRKTSITLAIDDSILKEIRKESEAKGLSTNTKLSAGFIHLIENTLKYHARCARILPSSVVLQIQEKSLEDINDEDMTQYLQEVLNELEKNRFHK